MSKDEILQKSIDRVMMALKESNTDLTKLYYALVAANNKTEQELKGESDEIE